MVHKYLFSFVRISKSRIVFSESKYDKDFGVIIYDNFDIANPINVYICNIFTNKPLK